MKDKGKNKASSDSDNYSKTAKPEVVTCFWCKGHCLKSD